MTLPEARSIDTARFVELNIGGMTCAACANTIERKLNRLDGIDASVNFATERALVSGIDETDAARAIEAVKKAGYSASVRSDNDDAWTERAAVGADLIAAAPARGVSASCRSRV